jgi:hypothetical protein
VKTLVPTTLPLPKLLAVAAGTVFAISLTEVRKSQP